MSSSTVTSTPAFNGDPFAIEVLRDRVQFDEELREAGSLVWLDEYQIWATGRYDVVNTIFRDHERFSSASGTGLLNIKKDKNWRRASVILDTDPPATPSSPRPSSSSARPRRTSLPSSADWNATSCVPS